MNKLQKIEFDILKIVIDICKELNLTYYLVCGSALGAVKYNGFIPWDDDVDIALPRHDYKIFCEKAQAMMPNFYFLQNHKTDPYYPVMYSKVRDSRTTYIEKSTSHLFINQGVYIDIFPLDGYPNDSSIADKLEKKKHKLKLQLACAFRLNSDQSLKAKVFLIFERFIGYHRHTQNTIDILENTISKWDLYNSEVWCNHGNWQGKLEYAPKWHYGEGTWAIFEGIKVRIPENYDAYLTQKYGNWRDDLPKEKQIGHHYYEVCDLTRSYVDYIEKQKNGKIRVIKPK